ncbi:MAG: hypothetical protein ACREQJ_13910, partial [Candidatus Binatia bacterium]
LGRGRRGAAGEGELSRLSDLWHPTHSPMIFAIIALALLLAAPASAIVLCTTPDGKTYAGDHPPQGCEVTTEYENPPVVPPTEEEVEAAAQAGAAQAIDEAETTRRTSVLASALRERRQLESDINDLAAELMSIRTEIANVPVVNAASYRDTRLGWQQYQEDLQETENYRTDLRIKEGEVLGQISALRTKFDGLTSHVRTELGTLPSTWASLRCSQCP